MFMGNIVSEWTNLDRRSFLTSETPTRSQHPRSTSSIEDSTAPFSPHSGPTQKNSTLGLWRGSPIHLLNSSVERQRINQSLGEVYTSMMSGIAIRYLDYHCNLFAGPYKYSFEPDQSGITSSNKDDAHPVTLAFTSPWRKTGPGVAHGANIHAITPESLASQINNVTMIGVARFLDNFGPLYGNVIDQKARSQNERTLTAVLQAFALQYLPSRQAEGPLAPFYDSLDSNSLSTESQSGPGDRGTNSLHIFTSAWYNAHSQLFSSIENRSFVRLYSVFLFLMTSVPEEATSTQTYEKSPLKLLDDALRQMEELQKLVEDYCEHLGRQSIYRFLLQSSVGIIRWYAYLRDTIDSVLHERPCMLEDAPLRSKGSLLGGHVPPQWQEPALFDQEVPRNCQNAAGDLFRIFRGVIHLRQMLLTGRGTFDMHATRNAVSVALGTTDEFTMTYGPWLDQCVISFYLLSEKSKLASAFMLLFWKLSKLLLVEQLHQAADMLPAIESRPMLEKAQSYQQAAVTSLLTIAQRIVDVSAMGEFRLINSVQAKMHFISHHANTLLVVLALSKAIEHTIDLHVSAAEQNDLGPAIFPSAAENSDWIASMKPLLTCLLTLDSTVSGTITARSALRKLMQRYGDLLMDCWSHEEVDDLPLAGCRLAATCNIDP
ncbi:hypothetical protein G647_06582 [Cladophialophora carrionii CBS 160.54]|uniref:Transcription factor domain-containing protein n=1 Tax=Cladophialophora carrionii CBS 160.54 TaxID=1279043 RepID=V9D962_9EURO|nr:uncharacterized protein G647_06582 [Cladophialophora carrionii CBS 160.54]ETI22507.1 hypothetical protein G647_06582 [Cladophialophora carrionii CBS 160.54]